MKKTIMKKIISSLCALAIGVTPLSAFAANTSEVGNASLIFTGFTNTQLSFRIIADFESPDFSTYTIASPYGVQAATVDANDWDFTPYYTMYGTGPDTMFFNLVLYCRNANNEAVARKSMRVQRAIYGDMNCDGVIDSKDIHALRSFISSPANTEDVNAYYHMKSLLAMLDLNNDSYIDEKDVTVLNDYLAGKDPIAQREFGSILWVTLDTDAVNALGLGNYGSTRLVIKTGNTPEDIMFNLYRN